MYIEQFYDTSLAHGSYAIVSAGQVALVDPGRDLSPYQAFAEGHAAKIVAVLETHPHADFVSCHCECQERFGANIYINPKVGVSYPHLPVDHGDSIKLGQVRFETLFTPGHSPDHNSYLLFDERCQAQAVFTGDSLFIGDVGRPDLREAAGQIQLDRESLARMMYTTIREVFAALDDHVVVYPAHGAGSLCGKNMSSASSSTIGAEREQNWAFQLSDEKAFVESYLAGQSFIPGYFPYNVELNRTGAIDLQTALAQVERLVDVAAIPKGALVIDTRPQAAFKAGHLQSAFNIMSQAGDKFETWLGSIVQPHEQFYLVSESTEAIEFDLRRVAKIGYEGFVGGATSWSASSSAEAVSVLQLISAEAFKQAELRYTVIDVRNHNEITSGKLVPSSMHLPLPELRGRIAEIPRDRPIVVHCAGGYRSAAAASILASLLPECNIFDLGNEVLKL